VGDAFHDAMAARYHLSEPAVVLGSPERDGAVQSDVRVQVALSMLNRHGLVAGATAKEQAREMARQQRDADAAARAQRREQAAQQRQRDRMVETGVRTAGRVLTSKAGQSLIRGVFGTLFGSR